MRSDLRGRVRAAHDAGVVHARHLNVVDVGGGAGDQPRIFAAADTFANQFPGGLWRDYGRHGMFLPALTLFSGASFPRKRE